MEELGADYKIVEHHRDEQTNRSQEDMFALHPIAKAPAIEVDGRIMIESGAIIEYLCEMNDGELAVNTGEKDRSAYLEWLHFAEGTVAMPMLMTLLGPRFGGLENLPIMKGFIDGEVGKLLDYIDGHMEGREFLVGDAITGADINMEYLLELGNLVGLLNDRAHAKAYLTRLMTRDAYIKAIEIGGPLTPAGR